MRPPVPLIGLSVQLTLNIESQAVKPPTPKSYTAPPGLRWLNKPGSYTPNAKLTTGRAIASRRRLKEIQNVKKFHSSTFRDFSAFQLVCLSGHFWTCRDFSFFWSLFDFSGHVDFSFFWSLFDFSGLFAFSRSFSACARAQPVATTVSNGPH